MSQLVPVFFLIAFLVIFGSALAILPGFFAKVFGLRKAQSAAKLGSYECGVEVAPQASTKIPIKYYLTAILFILFDIEIIFMYPWALAYGDFIEAGVGGFILGTMGIFLAVFIFGLFWEIKSRALEWD